MPTVEKVRGGRSYIRLVGRRFTEGDRAEVSTSEAEYLVEENGDFAYVEDGHAGDDGSPYRDRDHVADGRCGYHDPETMASPCARAAGWGRDADDGPCRDHGGD